MPALSDQLHTSGALAPSAIPDNDRGGHGARLTGLRAKLAALEVKHRQNAGARDGVPPAPTGIADLDARLGGGLPWGGVHELVAARAGDRAAMTGFALALAARLMARHGPGAGGGGNFLWVYPRRLAQETGLPYGPGLMAFGHDPGRFVLVEAARSADVLWAAEDALAAGPLKAVFALVDDTYAARAFTASRRFALAARTSGTSLFLLGGAGEKLTSAAPMRWQVAPVSAPSRRSAAPVPFPSRASWQVGLIRNRFGANGAWTLQWNHGTGAFSEITAPGRAGLLAENQPRPAPPPSHPPGYDLRGGRVGERDGADYQSETHAGADYSGKNLEEKTAVANSCKTF